MLSEPGGCYCEAVRSYSLMNFFASSGLFEDLVTTRTWPSFRRFLARPIRKPCRGFLLLPPVRRLRSSRLGTHSRQPLVSKHPRRHRQRSQLLGRRRQNRFQSRPALPHHSRSQLHPRFQNARFQLESPRRQRRTRRNSPQNGRRKETTRRCQSRGKRSYSQHAAHSWPALVDKCPYCCAGSRSPDPALRCRLPADRTRRICCC